MTVKYTLNSAIFLTTVYSQGTKNREFRIKQLNPLGLVNIMGSNDWIQRSQMKRCVCLVFWARLTAMKPCPINNFTLINCYLIMLSSYNLHDDYVTVALRVAKKLLIVQYIMELRHRSIRFSWLDLHLWAKNKKVF